MNEVKNTKFYRIFGSRKVFITYLICLFLITGTMAGSIITSLISTNHEKMIEHSLLSLIAIFLLHIPMMMRSKFSIRIPSWMHITITVFIVAHFVLGEVFRFYDHVFLFDKVLHLIAGIVIAMCGFSIVYSFSRTESGFVRLSPVFVAIFSFCFAVTILTLWEFFEYGMDMFFGLNMMRWRDGLTEIEIDGVIYLITSSQMGTALIDTMNDLLIGTIGAAIICILGIVWLKKFPKSTTFYIMKDKDLSSKSSE